MPNLLKVQGVSGLVRDPETKAIINTDIANFEKHIQTKKYMKNKNERLDILEKDVSDIKSLLMQLIEQGRT